MAVNITMNFFLQTQEGITSVCNIEFLSFLTKNTVFLNKIFPTQLFMHNIV